MLFNRFIEPIFEQELKSEIFQTSSDINRMFEKSVNGIIASVPDAPGPIFLKRQEDLLTKHENTNKEKFFSDLLFGASQRAEDQCSGSGKLAMYLCSLMVENKANISYDLYESIKKVVKNHIRRPKKDEFIDAVRNMAMVTKSDKYIDMLLDACFLGGIESKITTSIDQYSKMTVSYHHGFSFNVVPAHNIFYKIFGNSIINPKVLVYDGRINSPSEIFVLLHYAGKTKEPVVIFARGFSEGTIHDLKTNNLSGRLRVLPVVVPRTIDTVNALNDIALVTGSRLIMPQGGDVLSAFDHTILSEQTKKISLHPESMTILSGVPKETLFKRILELKNSALSSEHDFEKDVLFGRIKSLTLKNVNISVPSVDKTPLQLQNDFYEIDTALKLIQSTIRFGIIDVNAIFDDIKNLIKDDKTLVHIFDKYKDFILEKKNISTIPSIFIMASLRSAYSTYNLIKSSSIALVFDGDDNVV